VIKKHAGIAETNEPDWSKTVINDNPFAILTAVAAPAILTNACSVLALGTANRIARVVDRSRAVAKLRADGALETGGPAEEGSYERQFALLRSRSRLLLYALRCFYTALAMFASTALIAIVGSALVTFGMERSFHAAAVLGLLVGSLGVVGIACGCALMVRETHLAVDALQEEHNRMA
jgi:hypothetical protein